MFDYIDAMPNDAFLSVTLLAYWVLDLVFGAYGD
jgi:hypothetical protein